MTQFPSLQWIETEDGSPTCLDPITGETFHNPAGAWTEAVHHYAAPAGLDLSCPNPSHPQDPWCLLDVCFGLGYGTWASLARQAALTQAAPPIQVLAFEMDGNLNQAWHPVARSLEHRFPPGRALSLEIDPTGPGYQITARTGDRIAAHIEVRICDFRQQLAQLEL